MKKVTLFLLCSLSFIVAGCSDTSNNVSEPSPSIYETASPSSSPMTDPDVLNQPDPLLELLSAPVPETDPEKYILEQGAFLKAWEEEGGMLIDLRTPEEIKIEPKLRDSAQNFNYYAPGFGTQFRNIDSSTPLFLYCAHGNRSRNVRENLLKLGFTHVYDLKNGMSQY